MKKNIFKKRKTILQVEESNELAPKFDKNGLIPTITTDYKTGEVLMHGYMNKEAFLETMKRGEAVYFSRSRKKIWHKGKTSGLTQIVKEMRIDDDQDSVWLKVRVVGGASCHVGYRSCFYRSIPIKGLKNKYEVTLKFRENKKVFDPIKVYGKGSNPTKL